MLYRPSSKWQLIFALVGVVETLASLILHSVSLKLLISWSDTNENDAEQQTTLTLIKLNAIVLLSAFCYLPILVYDALETKNTIYTYAIAAFSAPTIALTALQYQQVEHLKSSTSLKDTTFISAAGSCLLASICVGSVSAALKVLATWKLYDEFAWTIYKHISADLRKRKIYYVFQTLKVLLKFDALFFITFLAQLYWLTQNQQHQQLLHRHPWKNVSIVFLSVMLFAMYLTVKFIRHEYHLESYLALGWYLACLAIFSWSMFAIIQTGPTTNDNNNRGLSSVQRYLIAMCSLNITMCLTTSCSVFACVLNFNKGLKALDLY